MGRDERMLVIVLIMVAAIAMIAVTISDRHDASERGTLAELLALPWAQTRGVQQEQTSGGVSTLMLEALGAEKYARYGQTIACEAYKKMNHTDSLAIKAGQSVVLPVRQGASPTK